MKLEESQVMRAELSRRLLPGASLITTIPDKTAIPRYVRLVMMMANIVPLGMAVWGFCNKRGGGRGAIIHYSSLQPFGYGSLWGFSNWGEGGIVHYTPLGMTVWGVLKGE